MLLNARSSKNKTSNIHDLIMGGEIDVVCVTETWVTREEDSLQAMCPPGFGVQHQPRLEGWEG